ncbi:MAG: hypothetical protein NC254_06400 [bacterium]|nr:hypothetical protein [bacterium]
MKKAGNLFWLELKRTVGSAGFVLLILAVTTMCVLIPVTLDDGTSVNCLTAFFTMSGEAVRAGRALNVGNILWQIASGYFVMFTPMLVSISLLPILCGEKESGAFRFLLYRSGKKQQAVGTFLACVLCGGVLMAAGYLLFAGVLIVHSFALSGSAGGMQVIKETGILILTKAAEVFTFRMMCAVWTYLTAVFVRNRYLLASIPYLVLWFLERRANGMDFSSVTEHWWRRLYVQVFGGLVFSNLGYMFQTLAVYTVIGAGVVCLHLAMQKRRTDCGM